MTDIFDLHDRAYYIWRDAGVRRAVLVHLDAHHDGSPAADWEPVNIGNYVRAAIREDLVAAVFWIVPDPMWNDAATRAICVDELAHIRDGAVAGDAGEPRAGARATIEGADVWMGPLADMPAVTRPVLLDVDVDYLLTTQYEKDRTAEPLAIPWCWPEDLVVRLRSAGIVPHLTTIATSVTGGFAQIRWSHLAREIAARLDEAPPARLMSCFAALRHAAELGDGGDGAGAVTACRAAVTACPADAAAHFHLASALQSTGQMDEARAAYRRARQLDPFYAHPFRTRGPYLYRRRRFREAAAAYREALALAPDDSHAVLGLAMVALAQGRPAEARGLAEQALLVHPDAVDGWRTLGRARRLLGDREGAIQAYDRALSLALKGGTGLQGPWASNPERRLIDPRHWADHAAAGELHAGLGALDAAIAHFRIVSAAVPDAARWQRRLAALEARRQIGRAFGGVLPS